MKTPDPTSLPLVAFSALLVALFFGLLIAAAIKDIRTMTIPNGLSIALVVLYPGFVAVSGVSWIDGLIAGGVVFGVGIVLFALGWLGGGDVKLLAATSLWAGTDLLLPCLFVTALAGGVLSAATWFQQRGLLKIFQGLTGKSPETDGADAGSSVDATVVPYGVAILAGGTFVAAAQLLPIYRIAETVL